MEEAHEYRDIEPGCLNVHLSSIFGIVLADAALGSSATSRCSDGSAGTIYQNRSSILAPDVQMRSLRNVGKRPQ